MPENFRRVNLRCKIFIGLAPGDDVIKLFLEEI